MLFFSPWGVEECLSPGEGCVRVPVRIRVEQVLLFSVQSADNENFVSAFCLTAWQLKFGPAPPTY